MHSGLASEKREACAHYCSIVAARACQIIACKNNNLDRSYVVLVHVRAIDRTTVCAPILCMEATYQWYARVIAGTPTTGVYCTALFSVL
jgi:hypothetical protein